MHSYNGDEEIEGDKTPSRRRMSLQMKYKSKPKIANALFHPVNVAVKVNTPVQIDAKLVKHKKQKSPKKGSSLRAALTAPLDVAVNVNTPDKTNISLDPFQKISRDLEPEKLRNKHKQSVMTGLVAPLNVAVNVNTPATIKCPIVKETSFKKKVSMKKAVQRPPAPRPLSSSAYQRMDSTISNLSIPPESGPTILQPPSEDVLKARRFNSSPNSIFTVSGCSESSCSSLDELSDSECCDVRPVEAYSTDKGKGFCSLRSIKSLKIPSSSSGGGSLRSSSSLRRDPQRPSVTGGIMAFMDLAIQVNTPVDARKVSQSFHNLSVFTM